MRYFLLLFASSTALLTACGSINDAKVSADDVMEMMETPDVEGLDSTMLRIARDAEQKGNFTLAAQTYQQLLDKSSNNTSYAIRYGENLRKSGQPKQALSVFHTILNAQPNNIDALEGKGLALLSLADTEAAGNAFTQVMQQSPNRWRTLNAIGILFATKAMYSEAQQYFDEALKLEQNHPAILNNKGLVLALDSRHANALQTLFKASKHARLPIQQIQADLNAALVYAIAGDTTQAEIMATRHLKGSALQNNLGLYALLSKDKGLAKTHLHMALSDSKTFYEKAWNNLQMIASPESLPQDDRAKRVAISGINDQVEAQPFSHLPSPPDASYSTSVAQPTSPQTVKTPSQQPITQSSSADTPTGVSMGTKSLTPRKNKKDYTTPSKKDSNKSNVSSGFEAFGDFITNW